jgi:hyperosmotically inducible periplasmic protein
MQHRTFLAALLVVGTTGLALAQQSAPPTQRLEKEIRHELLLLPYYGVFDDLAFQVQGDRVTLLGAVTRPSLKGDAEAVVKKIEGVAAVENRIEVLPLSPADDRLRLDIYHAIYWHSSLSRYALQAVPPIHIIVKNGNVRLEGVVASEQDKLLAGLKANQIFGAFKVANNLRVEQPQS